MKYEIDEFELREELEENGFENISKLIDEYSSAVDWKESNQIIKSVKKLLNNSKMDSELANKVKDYFNIL